MIAELDREDGERQRKMKGKSSKTDETPRQQKVINEEDDDDDDDSESVDLDE